MPESKIHYPILLEEVARVTALAPPLAVIEGFTSVVPGEIVVFENDTIGQILSVNTQAARCMLLTNESPVLQAKVFRTGQQLSIPVSSQMLGHVYNPLGLNETTEDWQLQNIDCPPPELVSRTRINRQLETGVTVVDSILPIGHGQRQLITGDAKTGKTAFLLSTALNQAKAGTVVIYTLIGKRNEDVQKVVKYFSQNEIMDKVVIVASTPTDSASVITLTPFTALTIAEYFRDLGQDTLVILDDLSTHAKFYREVALLEKKFPGRDSYPGDVFYTHARLLERAGCFKPGVAITCLPVAETTDGDLTDFIVSNLISITDGHLFFDARQFASGVLPAIDTTLSVTRVGKQTQSALGRSLNHDLTSFLNQFYKANQLTHFGGELSESSRKRLVKGAALQQILSQDRDQSLTTSAQHLLLGMACKEWLTNKTSDDIDEIKQRVSTALRREPTKSQLVALLEQADSLDKLLELLTLNQDLILELCKT